MLSWLNPVDADFATGDRRRTSTSPCPSREHLAAVARGAPGRSRGCTCTWTRAWPATAPPPPRWRALCRAARRAEQQRDGPGRRRDGPPRLRRRPGRPAPTPPAGPGSPGRSRSRAVGRAAAVAPAPGRHRGHPDRPAHATTPCAGSAPDWSASTRPAPRALRPRHDADRARSSASGGCAPGRRSATATPHRTAAPPRSALLPLGYADGLPRPPPAGPRCWSAAGGARSSGRISMDQTVVDLGRPGPSTRARPVTVFGPGRRRRADRRRLGRLGGHDRARDRHRHRRRASAPHVWPRPAPAEPVDEADPGGRDRRRPELRARRLARLGRVRRRRRSTRRRTTSCR